MKLTANDLLEARNGPIPLAGGYLRAINDRQVDNWLVERVAKTEHPQFGVSVTLEVWVGDWIVGIEIFQPQIVEIWVGDCEYCGLDLLTDPTHSEETCPKC